MSNEKISNGDLLSLYSGISMLLDNDNNKYEFNYALIKNKHRIKKHFEEADEMIKMLEKERINLVSKYCDKDSDGKAIIKNNIYQGLQTGQNPDFDKLNEELIDKRKSFMKAEVEFEPYKIRKEHLPKTMNGSAQDAIFILLEEEEKNAN